MLSSNCVFCDKAKSEIILENQQAKAFFDIHPMAKGHMLMVPKEHYQTWFEIPEETQIQLIQLMNKAKQFLDQQYSPRGYQVFSHIGKIAGQKINHAHFHLVPVY